MVKKVSLNLLANEKAKANAKEQVKTIKVQQTELARLNRLIEGQRQKGQVHSIPIGKKHEIRFGVFSDLQVGSLYSHPEWVFDAMKAGKVWGIKDWFVPGDIYDGNKVYRGQEFEQDAIGLEKEDEKFRDSVKQPKGIKVHFITGNHDEVYKKQSGINIGEHIEEKAKEAGLNWDYIGSEYADLSLETPSGRVYKVALLHPGGGTPYAISYATQKAIEALPGGQKPQMLLIGHLHKAELLPMARNVCGVQTGCFQSQTPFMKRMRSGGEAHTGFWMFKIIVSGDFDFSSVVTSTFVAFYEPSGKK